MKKCLSGTPVMRISGPDIIRYFFARIVIFLDRLLCKLGLLNGFERIIIAKRSNKKALITGITGRMDII